MVKLKWLIVYYVNLTSKPESFFPESLPRLVVMERIVLVEEEAEEE